MMFYLHRLSDQVGGLNRAGPRVQPRRDALHARMQSVIAEQPLDGAVELGVAEGVGREAHAEAGLMHALRVIVLVPEQRQRDHRFAMVEALRDRIVAAMRHYQID